MPKLMSSLLVGSLSSLSVMTPAFADAALFLAYPPEVHQTTSDRIFLIGTANPDQPVLVNGEPIVDRSESGHFAPTVPLSIGANTLTLTQGEASVTVQVTRVAATPTIPPGSIFLLDSITPQVDIAKPTGEQVCFQAIALPDIAISVAWGGTETLLAPMTEAVALPPNSAVLTAQNAPVPIAATPYIGCTVVPSTGQLGRPTYTLERTVQSLPPNTPSDPVLTNPLTSRDALAVVEAPGAIERLPDRPFKTAIVTAAAGVARTGPSTSYSRITPLPQGTRAQVTAMEGDWLRLEYGGWIRASETDVIDAQAPPQSIIRSVTSRQVPGWTEVRFPLQTPVPITIDQTTETLTLTLHNTTPQTDTIYLAADPVIKRLDWTPVLPDKAQYRFQLKPNQQWGYKTRYEGTTLVLSLRHPPVLANNSLAGSVILIDPGHGSENDLGARGPNGYPEKDVNLVVSKLLQEALVARGARVVMTREGDDDLFPRDRVDIIHAEEPTLALSIHYNALPDAGDALNTAGIGMFWYNAQAHSLAQFLHDDLVTRLNRPSYGVYWNNLALTRPTVTPSVLLELGFMINPYEFEWITDPDSQQQLADALADAVVTWMQQATEP
ncbi:MAG: N-acetylmuramoyl-L-alanine amidase [Cyanobacteria bacterium J06638_28]